jgi:excisionase family DNA binding protein
MTGPECLPKEIANLLRLSERQIRREIAAGRLKVHCFGRAVRIHPEDLAAYLATHRRPVAQPSE